MVSAAGVASDLAGAWYCTGGAVTGIARMDDNLKQHCAELDCCNQRGGRMLSVFDLLDAGTLDLDLAAYLMARISSGASFMVGALPGGAGKTTVMAALLNLAPADRPLAAATAEAVHSASQIQSTPRCYICHEISPAHYFCYLWGEALREYCGLGRCGHMLATNLHADDLVEARDQVCGENAVPIEDFGRFDLLVFLRVDGGLRPRRRIERVYCGDGGNGHRLIFDAAAGLVPDLDSPECVGDSAYARRCREFLERTWAAGTRTIEQTRQAVLEFFSASSPAAVSPAGRECA
jgi:hypothetical protein